MEPKELTYLQAKLTKEFEEIIKTEFWKNYNKRLEKIRDSASRLCETQPIEKILKFQGIVRGIDLVLEIPDKILGIPQRKNSQEE